MSTTQEDLLNLNSEENAEIAESIEPETVTCRKCGKAVDITKPFCPYCGKKVKIESENDKPKKNNKLKIIIISAVSVALLILAICFAPIAIQTYKINKIESLVNEFNEDKITYDEALSIINSLNDRDNKDIRITASYTKQSLYSLRCSKQNYNSGVECLKKKQYESALDKLEEVVEKDINYPKAQSLIKQNKEKFVEEIFNNVDKLAKENEFREAKIKLEKIKDYYDGDKINQKINYISEEQELYEEKQKKENEKNEKKRIQKAKDNQKVIVTKASVYYNGYSDNIGQVVLKNKTEKVVRDAEVIVLQFDKNGYPVDSEYYDLYGGHEYIANIENASHDSLNVNIQPGETWGSNKEWYFSNDTALIKACVRSVEFYDGSTWNNEYFDYWLNNENARY